MHCCVNESKILKSIHSSSHSAFVTTNKNDKYWKIKIICHRIMQCSIFKCLPHWLLFKRLKLNQQWIRVWNAEAGNQTHTSDVCVWSMMIESVCPVDHQTLVLNPNNCTPRMEIWFWSAVDNWIFQFPSPNVFVFNNSPIIIDVMAVGARSERMRFVIFQLSISNMSQQKTTNDCHLSQEHSTSAKGNSLAHLWMTRLWSEFQVFSIVQDLVSPLRFHQQCRG